jgi:membrane associated rhomboid family serine protease
MCRFGAIPGASHGRRAEPDGGAGSGPAVVQLGSVPRWALVTSMFLHGSWLHLIANMWFLWLFGNNVEDSMGHGRFAVFYLLTGVAGDGRAHLRRPRSLVPMVGASGAISGVMGAYLVLYPRSDPDALHLRYHPAHHPVPAWFVLILWFALQLLSGYTDPMATSGVAVWAHVGGFVAGVLLIKLFENRELVRGCGSAAYAGPAGRGAGSASALANSIHSGRSQDEAVPPFGPVSLCSGSVRRRTACHARIRNAAQSQVHDCRQPQQAIEVRGSGGCVARQRRRQCTAGN